MNIKNFLIPIIGELVKLLTPVLVNDLRQFAANFYWNAQDTSNPFDDIVAGGLLGLLGMDTPNVKPDPKKHLTFNRMVEDYYHDMESNNV